MHKNCVHNRQTVHVCFSQAKCAMYSTFGVKRTYLNNTVPVPSFAGHFEVSTIHEKAAILVWPSLYVHWPTSYFHAWGLHVCTSFSNGLGWVGLPRWMTGHVVGTICYSFYVLLLKISQQWESKGSTCIVYFWCGNHTIMNKDNCCLKLRLCSSMRRGLKQA